MAAFAALDWGVLKTTPLRELAEVIPVSEAMVGKVEKFDFVGGREFRLVLVDFCRSDTASLHSETYEDDTAGEIGGRCFAPRYRRWKGLSPFRTLRPLTARPGFCTAQSSVIFIALAVRRAHDCHYRLCR